MTNAVVSDDGSLYAYTGRVRSGGTTTNELVVRRTADDALVARTSVAEARYLLGWVFGRPALRNQEGTELFTYDPSTLEERSGIRVTARPGHSPGSFASITSGVLQYVSSGECAESEQTGPLSLYEAVTVTENGASTSTTIGCAPDDLQFVSPDGRWLVRPGDETTVRTATTGRPVGPLHPTGWPVGTTVYWEPDSRHVQVVGYPDGDSGPAVTLRCAVADGSCVRAF